MKKIALLLALVMTLSVAAVASAAEVKTSGELSYTLGYANEALYFDGLGMKLRFDAKVSDQISAAIRFRPLTISKTAVVATPPAKNDVASSKVDQAYVTISKFGLPLTVTLGLNTVVNDPGFGFDGYGMVPGDVTGWNIKTDSFNGFSAQLVGTAGYTDKNNFKAAFLNYSADFGSFGLIVKPVKVNNTEDKMDFAVSANVPVPSTPVKGLVEYIGYADSNKKADYYVGAEATVAGVDVYGKYFSDNNDSNTDNYKAKITAGVSKEINGATYAIDLENYTSLTDAGKAAGMDSSSLSITFGVTVAF